MRSLDKLAALRNSLDQDTLGRSLEWRGRATGESMKRREKKSYLVEISRDILASARSKKLEVSASRLNLESGNKFYADSKLRTEPGESLKIPRSASKGLLQWDNKNLSFQSGASQRFEREQALKDLDKIVGGLKARSLLTEGTKSQRRLETDAGMTYKKLDPLTHSKLTSVKFNLMKSQTNLAHCNIFARPAKPDNPEPSVPRVDFVRTKSFQQYLDLKKAAPAAQYSPFISISKLSSKIAAK